MKKLADFIPSIHNYFDIVIAQIDEQFSALVACAPLTPPARVQSPFHVEDAYRNMYLALHDCNTGDCLRGSHDHVNGRCRLANFESDVREPMRTTSSLAVTTLSHPIYTTHIIRHGHLASDIDGVI